MGYECFCRNPEVRREGRPTQPPRRASRVAARKDGVRDVRRVGDPIRFAPGTSAVTFECSLARSPREKGIHWTQASPVKAA